MPRIKNWNKLNDLEYEYRPNTDVTAEIYDGEDQHWYGDLYFKGDETEHIFSGKMNKTEARETFVYWLMENPEVEIEGSDDQEGDTGKPDSPCLNYNDCGNETPGGANSSNQICDECMERIRG